MDPVTVIFAYAILWIFMGLVGVLIYRSNHFAGFLLGFLFGPIGWLIGFCLQSNEVKMANSQRCLDMQADYFAMRNRVEMMKLEKMRAQIRMKKREPKPVVEKKDPAEVKIACPKCGQHLLIESPKHGETYECPICKNNICMI